MIKKNMEITHKKIDSKKGHVKYEIIYSLTDMPLNRRLVFELMRHENIWYIFKIIHIRPIPREVLLKIENILRGLNS